MEIDTLKLYTTSKLVDWGRQMRGGALGLDFASVNTIYRMMRALPPGRTEISDDAMLTEEIVSEVAKEAPDAAVILRARYCGYTRFAEQHRRRAEQLLGRKLSRRAFWALHDDGFQRVREFFEFLLRAAA